MFFRCYLRSELKMERQKSQQLIGMLASLSCRRDAAAHLYLSTPTGPAFTVVLRADVRRSVSPFLHRQ